MNARREAALAALRLLAWDLRVATDDQLTRHIGGDHGLSREQMRAVTKRLRNRRLLSSALLPVALPALHEPIASWAPGDRVPDFEAVAWAAAERVRATPAQRVRVLWATAATLRAVGGVECRLRKPLQIEHDLGVSSMHFACRDSTNGDAWCGEDRYRLWRRPTRGQKSPDAVLLDAEGSVTLVLDYLTAYTVPRLRRFHHYWSARRKPYQWW